MWKWTAAPAQAGFCIRICTCVQVSKSVYISCTRVDVYVYMCTRRIEGAIVCWTKIVHTPTPTNVRQQHRSATISNSVKTYTKTSATFLHTNMRNGRNERENVMLCIEQREITDVWRCRLIYESCECNRMIRAVRQQYEKVSRKNEKCRKRYTKWKENMK